MKKIKLIFTIAVVSAFTLQSCSKENDLSINENFVGNVTTTPTGTTNASGLVVLEEQRAVVTYVGATWCPPCGAYGDPTKIYMEDTHNDDVVILNVQSVDAISARGAFGPIFGSVFQTSVGSTSIPHAYWSGANFAMVHRGFSSTASSNNGLADGNINEIIGNSPDVGIAAKASLSGTTVTVETLTKFYKSAGEHYVGVYLLEDGVEALQENSTLSNPEVTSHENVIRAAAYATDSLGVESIGTMFTVDEEVSGTYSIKIPSTVLDNSQLQIAVVVWENKAADGISNAILVNVK